MARPKTLGPVVSMRLPLALHRELEKRAASVQMSPGHFVRSITELALRPPPEPVIPTKSVEIQVGAEGCRHYRKRHLRGGVVKCLTCGKEWDA